MAQEYAHENKPRKKNLHIFVSGLFSQPMTAKKSAKRGRPSLPAGQRRIATNVSIDPSLLAKARDKSLNLSRLMDKAIAQELT